MVDDVPLGMAVVRGRCRFKELDGMRRRIQQLPATIQRVDSHNARDNHREGEVGSRARQQRRAAVLVGLQYVEYNVCASACSSHSKYRLLPARSADLHDFARIRCHLETIGQRACDRAMLLTASIGVHETSSICDESECFLGFGPPAPHNTSCSAPLLE